MSAWPYDLPIWRRAHRATSPDGLQVAAIDAAHEVSMGNPTRGTLTLSSGLTLEECNPSFVWSDDSRYLAVPTYFHRFWFFRLQRVALIDTAARRVFVSRRSAVYFQPESFDRGLLVVTAEPFKTKRQVTWRIPEDLEHLESFEVSAVGWPTQPTGALGRVGFGEALRVWAKIGFLSFGGPAGQVALMHKELVEERRWIDEERFLHALNYCMLLPGPEAQQLATYIGWLMHRTRGGVAAGLLFVFPGFAAILALSVVYAAFQRVPVVNALFFGLKAAVLALVVEAVLRIGRRALKTRLMIGVAAVAFFALFLFDAPFPLVVLAAAMFGFVGSRVAPHLFPSPKSVDAAEGDPTVIDLLARRGELAHTKPDAGRAVRILATCLVLWVAPIAALGALLGWSSVWVEEGVFFSKTAVVTFGGAYAVLAYIAQRAVETYGWLKPGEMLDGLGLAETTPGPLIMVVQFVGFMGAYRNPGPLTPMIAGVLGSCITVWVTFVPCFLWILLGAPYIEALRGNRSLHAALSAITAAVVGVILNLTIWFGAHVVFGEVHERPFAIARLLVPVWSTVNVPAAVLAAAAMVAMFRFKVGALKVLAACAAAGVAWSLLAV